MSAQARREYVEAIYQRYRRAKRAEKRQILAIPSTAVVYAPFGDSVFAIEEKKDEKGNPVTEKADRIGFRTLNDGRKVRFYKSNGEVIGA